MDERARQTLLRLVAEKRDIALDQRLCKAFLLDLCAQCRGEIRVLVLAVEEGLTAELLNHSGDVPAQVLIARLAHRLHEDCRVVHADARWAVESWALALGVVVGTGNGQRDVARATRPSGLMQDSLAIDPPLLQTSDRCRIHCPACGRLLKVAVKAAGRQLQCPACGKLLSVSSNRDKLCLHQISQPREITNSIGMKLVLIPAGDFMMGSPESEKDHQSDEGPVHRVRITKPFYLGQYQVTQGEYERVMGKNPSYFSAKGDGKVNVPGQDTSQFPVECVSWNDAMSFYWKLSRQEGNTYRLPTEAEWEYACRAGTTTPFSFGSVLNGREANCAGNYPYGTKEHGPYLGRPIAVGSYRPNGFGLYDMHGNVWEWCSDWYDSSYYANSPTEDPTGPTGGSHRVRRGGGWCFGAGVCRSAYRFINTSEFRSYYLGFRVVREAAD